LVAALPALGPPLERDDGAGLAHQRRHAAGAQAAIGSGGRVVADALRTRWPWENTRDGFHQKSQKRVIFDDTFFIYHLIHVLRINLFFLQFDKHTHIYIYILSTNW
jgi:hypothetical protein